MTITISWLSADKPLTKTFAVDGAGQPTKSAYPNVKNFTSVNEVVENTRDLYLAVQRHAERGNCLLKGTLQRKLILESRAGATNSDSATRWLCLDIDAADVSSVDAVLAHIPQLTDVAHVVQYSSSYGVMSDKKLSCHVFYLLDEAIAPSELKVWLMNINLSVGAIRKHICLTRTAAYLHWPIDITACQNDKLLYIAPPIIGKGVTTTIAPHERIVHVNGGKGFVTTSSLRCGAQMEALKETARELRNDLRIAAGLKPIRTSTKWVGEFEVQTKPGEATLTGTRYTSDFVYLNLNGGDSWGYFHPTTNPEYIHNFKGEPIYLTRELLPTYYKALKERLREAREEVTEAGTVILAFRDKRTGEYLNGTWDAKEHQLALYPAKSELMLNHWMQCHGQTPHEVIPVWDKQFLPQEDFVVDVRGRRINTFNPTEYMRMKHAPTTIDQCPLIKRIMLHAVTNGAEDETFEHWLNWLAVIFQLRVKPQTAWVLHGVEGTGKGVIVNKILAPLLGRDYVQSKRASELTDQFNGWLENALIAFIDEMEITALRDGSVISGSLRNFITDDYVTIRQMRRTSEQKMNYTGFIFSSNKGAPVQMSENDRRYNVGAFQPHRLFLTSQEVEHDILGELPTFISYLMTRTADRQAATRSIDNHARTLMVAENETSIESVVKIIKNGSLDELYDSMTQASTTGVFGAQREAVAIEFNRIVRNIITVMTKSSSSATNRVVNKLVNGKQVVYKEFEQRVRRDELMVIFEHCVGNMPNTPNKFTSMLRHKGIVTERMRIEGAPDNGLIVTWSVPAEWLAAVKPTNKLTALRAV